MHGVGRPKEVEIGADGWNLQIQILLRVRLWLEPVTNASRARQRHFEVLGPTLRPTNPYFHPKLP